MVGKYWQSFQIGTEKIIAKFEVRTGSKAPFFESGFNIQRARQMLASKPIISKTKLRQSLLLEYWFVTQPTIPESVGWQTNFR